MNHRSRKRILVFLFAGVALVGAVAAYSFGWVAPAKLVRGERCIRCGAAQIKIDQSFSIFGVKLLKWHSQQIETNGLTTLWSHYRGGCAHEWVLDYVNTWDGRSRMFGDGFPHFRYPAAGGHNEDLASAIELLPTTNARIAALDAVGSGSNWLRFLAADALRDLGNQSSETAGNWWRAHSNCFEIVTDKTIARAKLGELGKSRCSQFSVRNRGIQILTRSQREVGNLM